MSELAEGRHLHVRRPALHSRPADPRRHGPAALLGLGDDFPYAGYSIAAFPDRVDRFTPTIGYLPGRMPWWFGEKLEAKGVSIVNKLATGTCHRDRRLITGDSPDAANAFGRMAAEALLG